MAKKNNGKNTHPVYEVGTIAHGKVRLFDSAILPKEYLLVSRSEIEKEFFKDAKYDKGEKE